MGQLDRTPPTPLTHEQIEQRIQQIIEQMEAAPMIGETILFGNGSKVRDEEKRVFYVEVGNDPEKTEQAVRRIIKRAKTFVPNEVTQFLLETEHPDALKQQCKDALESIREGNSYRFE